MLLIFCSTKKNKKPLLFNISGKMGRHSDQISEISTGSGIDRVKEISGFEEKLTHLQTSHPLFSRGISKDPETGDYLLQFKEPICERDLYELIEDHFERPVALVTMEEAGHYRAKIDILHRNTVYTLSCFPFTIQNCD